MIVDLSAEGGGNCEDTRPGETAELGQVTIVAPLNVPSLLGEDESEPLFKNQQHPPRADDEEQHHHDRWVVTLAKTALTHDGQMKNQCDPLDANLVLTKAPTPEPAAKVA